MNKWFAECVPCKWQETHDTQDAAISAAESHAINVHRDLFSLPSDVRSREMADKRISHVQLRDENAIGAGVSTGVAAPAETAPQGPVDEQLAAAESELDATLQRVAALRAMRAMGQKE